MSDEIEEGLEIETGAAWPPNTQNEPDPAEAKAAEPPMDKSALGRAFVRVAALMALTVTINTLSGSFSGVKSSYLIKNELHLTASAFASLAILTGLPSYLRPIFGAFTDLVPFLGYHRRSYYAIGPIISAAGTLGLASLSTYTEVSVVSLIILSGIGGTLMMLMADAMMVRVGNRTGQVATIQSIQQLLPNVLYAAGLAALGGYTAQHWSYHACFLATAVVTICTLPCVLLIDEKKLVTTQQAHETAVEHAERMAERARDRQETLQALGKAARSVELWAVVGYVFYLIFTPSVNLAQFYYGVNHLHFTPQFIGDLGTPGSIGTIVGILLFGVASRWVPVRAIVWGAWLMDCFSYPLLYMYNSHTTAIISTFLGGAIGIIYNLCLFTIAARACPPKIEGTIYGLVMSTIYLSGAISEKVGDSIFDHLGGENMARIVYAYHTSIVYGLLLTLPACIFIPFLPKWTRSNEPLRPRPTEAAATG